MPRDSPSFQWGAGVKLKLFGSPQERTKTLSSSPAPTGTAGWGMLGICHSKSSSCPPRFLTFSSSSLIRVRRLRPSLAADCCFSRAASFRAWRRPSSSSSFWRRSESSSRISSNGALSCRLATASRTKSTFSRINFRSIIIFINPIPFIPLPLARGRGVSYIREVKPLFNFFLNLYIELTDYSYSHQVVVMVGYGELHAVYFQSEQ
ncbi:hypothetical protein ES708_19774 [subsurface metagenome]